MSDGVEGRDWKAPFLQIGEGVAGSSRVGEAGRVQLAGDSASPRFKL